MQTLSALASQGLWCDHRCAFKDCGVITGVKDCNVITGVHSRTAVWWKGSKTVVWLQVKDCSVITGVHSRAAVWLQVCTQGLRYDYRGQRLVWLQGSKTVVWLQVCIQGLQCDYRCALKDCGVITGMDSGWFLSFLCFSSVLVGYCVVKASHKNVICFSNPGMIHYQADRAKIDLNVLILATGRQKPDSWSRSLCTPYGAVGSWSSGCPCWILGLHSTSWSLPCHQSIP